MGIREVLQTELWSKETSRKIIRKTLVVMKFAGIGLGALVVVIGLWIVVWTHWLTSKERNAGKIALAEVDALQSSVGASNAEFQSRANRAKEKVDAAREAVLTVKDEEAFLTLSFYLKEVQWMRDGKEMREKWNAQPGHEQSLHSKEMFAKSEELDRNTVKVFRDSSHEILDK